MKILFAYYNHPTLSTIPYALLRSLQQNGNKVITCGISDTHAAHTLDIECKKSSPSILDVLKQTSIKLDWIFICWPRSQFFLTDIEKCPIPTAVYAVDTHLPLVRKELTGYSLLFNVIFSSQKDFVGDLQMLEHPHVYWLPFAADTTLYPKIKVRRNLPVSFVGTTNPLHNPKRSIYLAVVKYLFPTKIAHLFGRDMTRLLTRSHIIINTAVTNDLNARVFEAMAAGGLLLTPAYQYGLHDLFKTKTHLVSYSSIGDLLYKIKYYLSHTIQREKIAANGKQEIWKKHTYQHRAKTIVHILKQYHQHIINHKIDWNTVALSYYLLGAVRKRKVFAQSKKFQTLVIGLYSKYSAIQILIWQLRHF